ncbi:hypothetical protein F4779DRAFT_634222 [Xylariaceae sp. FL0662B]|nr:hypothetical protein F4779DRAFT_634222 [Xylariaceae sp. FL0662B]
MPPNSLPAMPPAKQLTPAKRPAEDDRSPRKPKSVLIGVSTPTLSRLHDLPDNGFPYPPPVEYNTASLPHDQELTHNPQAELMEISHTAYKHRPEDCPACHKMLRIIHASEQEANDVRKKSTHLENEVKSLKAAMKAVAEAAAGPTPMLQALEQEVARLEAANAALEAKAIQAADSASATLQARTAKMRESFDSRVAAQVKKQMREAADFEERARVLEATHYADEAALEDEAAKLDVRVGEQDAAIRDLRAQLAASSEEQGRAAAAAREDRERLVAEVEKLKTEGEELKRETKQRLEHAEAGLRFTRDWISRN